jgi:hypothetical protein
MLLANYIFYAESQVGKASCQFHVRYTKARL